MEKPNPNYDSSKDDIAMGAESHEDYRHATGKCSVCDRKLRGGNCPQGH